VSALALLALTVVVLVNFRLLGGSRMVPIIRGGALQGVLLAGVAFALRFEHVGAESAALAILTAAIKGFLLPGLLLRALRQVEIRREVEPFVGYNLSLLFGALALGAGVLVSQRFAPGEGVQPLLASVGVFTLLTGLFLVVTRRKAITQALGYLVFENGIYAIGLCVAPEQPLLVELGILLDVLVAVFVMGIIIFHIQRDFSHIDVDALETPSERPREAGA